MRRLRFIEVQDAVKQDANRQFAPATKRWLNRAKSSESNEEQESFSSVQNSLESLVDVYSKKEIADAIYYANHMSYSSNVNSAFLDRVWRDAFMYE